MASNRKRHQHRKKRKQTRGRVEGPVFDVHSRHAVDSAEAIEKLVLKFAEMDDPLAAIRAAFNGTLAEFVDSMADFDPYRLIEICRMAYLPWSRPGMPAPTPVATAAHVELIALISLAAAQDRAGGDVYPAMESQDGAHFATDASGTLESLLEMSHLRAIASSDLSHPLSMISMLLRGSQVLVRHGSYAELAKETVLQLLDGNVAVREALVRELGFDASDAFAVLDACHDIQHDQINERGAAYADAMNVLMPQAEAAHAAHRASGEEPPEELGVAFRAATAAFFEPDRNASTVSLTDVASRSEIPVERVTLVVQRFQLDLTGLSAADVVEAFTSGSNPMRTNPLIVTPDGRMMLPHNVLTVDAVKESLEDHLKGSPVWTSYAKHRGNLLEKRTRDALERVLPGAMYRDAFEYYLPANDSELEGADPSKYTKRVEGDHLAILDDVALIVEDKAGALSALSKGGKTTRLRQDLTSIITRAAEQSGRLREAIERDGGIRVQGEGWIDLAHIREIHSVAVSLDDLMSVTTATSELVRAGLLAPDNIPWTVSIHDLDLITDLVDRPAEFLLYLRRRLNPDVTVMFTAADELDLFLYFFEAGLWVEPDPDQVRAAFDWLPAPTTAERRRFRQQEPVYLTSRTDALDAWYHSRSVPEVPQAPKPQMVATPLADLIDGIQATGVSGWLSIGATLLECATGMQHKMALNPEQLLNAPTSRPQGRSLTMPLTATVNPAEAWLFVWATRPAGQDPARHEVLYRDYLRTKKFQLGIPRGVVLLYDEGSRDLVGVYYDGHIGELSDDLSARLSSLRPPTALSGRLHPNAFRTPKGKPVRQPRRRRR